MCDNYVPNLYGFFHRGRRRGQMCKIAKWKTGIGKIKYDYFEHNRIVLQSKLKIV
jgi:hypothetical protein